MARILNHDAEPHFRKAFTQPEIQLLDRLVPNKKAAHHSQKNVSYYILKLAKLARSGDPPQGNRVIWRGLSRLTDIQLGFELAQRLVGN